MQYEDALLLVYEKGVHKESRAMDTISYHGVQMRYDMMEGFPLITSKTVYFKSVVRELLWFLYGSTDRKWLHDNNCHIWDEWQKPGHEGTGFQDMGPIYGYQWRSWLGAPYGPSVTVSGKRTYLYGENGIDQISNVIDEIKNNPYSRRLIVNAWNPADIKQAALPPCHFAFQFTVSPNKKGIPTYLNIHVMQRSADMFLGVPFNIASYSLLTALIANQTGLKPKYYVHSITDAHIYENQKDAVSIQLQRKKIPLPDLISWSHKKVDLQSMFWEEAAALYGTSMSIRPEHFKINGKHCGPKSKDPLYTLMHVQNYKPHPSIAVDVVV